MIFIFYIFLCILLTEDGRAYTKSQQSTVKSIKNINWDKIKIR